MEEKIEKNDYINNDFPFFSVIVPTFNVEEYVEECINSVINQSYDGWELIIVDDGSCDSTSDICRSYALRDARISFIQNQHGMQAKARNTGIKVAKGQYICFLDSDDFWNAEHLKNLKQCIVNALYPDMCIANQHTNIYENETKTIILFPYESVINNSLQAVNKIKELIFARDNWVPGATVLNTYKNLFLKENDICFDEMLSLSEDLDFFMQGISRAQSLCIYDKEYYYYRQTNPNSTIHTIDIGKLNDRLNVCQKWYLYLNDVSKKCKEKEVDCTEWMQEAQYKLATQIRTTYNDAASLIKVGDAAFVRNAKDIQYILKEKALGDFFSEYTLIRIKNRVMHYYWLMIDILKVIVHKWRECHD